MQRSSTNNNSQLGIILIGILFFIFGFITWANSQLIPYFKLACDLNDAQSYYVATAFFAAYFFTSLPCAALLKKVGFKNGMSIGLIVMAIGAVLFIPAANIKSYPLFLTGLFIIGTGLALLQTASNPYVTILGPIESAAQRMSIMGICNKTAGIIAVYVFSSIALKNADAIKAQLHIADDATKENITTALLERVIAPYGIIAAALIVLAILVYKIMPNFQDDTQETTKQQVHNEKKLWQYPQLVFGAIALFLYVGVEVIAYDTFTNFGTYNGYTLDKAKEFAAYTGYSMLLGYVLSIILIPKVISQRVALAVSAISSIAFVLLAIYSNHELSIISFALLGLSNAAIWPAIWPLAINGLGKHTKIASAILVMCIVGGAILPVILGKITDVIATKKLAYLIMIPCYIIILWYAMWSKKKPI